MKDIIDEVSQQSVEYLSDIGLVKLENYFLDGTKIEANANRYSFVWKKSTEKNREKLRQKVKDILDEIDRANELEDKLYGNNDLPEMGEHVRLDELKQEARQNLLSEVGIALRKRRCIEPEYVFGRVKWCWGFRRFLLRGIEKVKVEWGLLSMAHNLSRLAVVWDA